MQRVYVHSPEQHIKGCDMNNNIILLMGVTQVSTSNYD
jgi:hypothetical protein